MPATTCNLCNHRHMIGNDYAVIIPCPVKGCPCRNLEKILETDEKVSEKHASREEQHGRYLDCGPQNWDDRDNPDF